MLVTYITDSNARKTDFKFKITVSYADINKIAAVSTFHIVMQVFVLYGK